VGPTRCCLPLAGLLKNGPSGVWSNDLTGVQESGTGKKRTQASRFLDALRARARPCDSRWMYTAVGPGRRSSMVLAVPYPGARILAALPYNRWDDRLGSWLAPMQASCRKKRFSYVTEPKVVWRFTIGRLFSIPAWWEVSPGLVFFLFLFCLDSRSAVFLRWLPWFSSGTCFRWQGPRVPGVDLSAGGRGPSARIAVIWIASLLGADLRVPTSATSALSSALDMFNSDAVYLARKRTLDC